MAARFNKVLNIKTELVVGFAAPPILENLDWDFIFSPASNIYEVL
jgi:hypothetical protein